MNAFTPAIRASLLSDATKGASLRRWSIRDLLNFHPTTTTTTTTTSDDGGNDHHAAAAAAAAAVGVESLLREVQIRLAMQHSKLSSFSTSMNEGGVWCGSAKGGSSGTTTTRRRRRSGGDDDHEDEDEDEAEGRARARACLGSLMQLHENTYLLPHRIVDGDWRGLLENFDKKPNRKYVSGVFDEIMSRHGSSVETFADAVIHARNGAGMVEEGRMHRDDDDVPDDESRPRCSTTTRGGGYRSSSSSSSSSGEEEVPEFLRNESIESFLHSRLMIQLLCDHYISLGRGKVTGAISLGADVAGVIDDAATEARHVCDANLGIAPEFRIIARPPEEEEDDGAMMVVVGRRDDEDSHPPPPPIIRSWLHHAIVEVVKNAMTSNVQRHYITRRSEEEGSTPPAVDISFGIMETMTTTGDDGKSSTDNSSSSRYLKIRITDRGIGLEDKEQAFGFARSSSPKRWDRLEEQQSYAAVRQPLGSLGVGLPLSRLMMRAFGGDLDISNNNDIGEEGEGGGIGGGCTATLTISYDDTHIAEN